MNCQAGHPLPFPCPSLSYPPPTQSQPYLYHSPPALPLPTLLLSHIRLLSPIPSLPYPSLDPVQLCGLWEHCKFPQRVRAEPGRQTPSGAFSAYLDAFFSKHFHASCLLKLGSGSPCTEIDKTSVAAGSSHNTAASYHRQFIYYIRHSVLLPHSH